VSTVTGVALLVYTLGGVLWLQWRFAVEAVTPSPDDVGGLRGYAIAAAGCALMALASGRVRWPVLLLALGLAAWVAARALSAWMLDSQVEAAALLLALALAGLVIAVAAIPAAVSGWTLAAVGAAYIYVNLFVLWQNYFTTAARFPGVARWALRTEPPYILEITKTPPFRDYDAFPSPEAFSDRVWVFLRSRDPISPPADLWGYWLDGLGGHPQATGSAVALCVVFLAAFSLRRWSPWYRSNPVPVVLGRLALFAATVLPGLALLHLFQSRAALGGVLAALVLLVLPLRWARGRAWSWSFAIATPLLIILPPAVTAAGVTGWNNRDCAWQDWWSQVTGTRLWGYGPPDSYPISACPRTGGRTSWAHAHNELLNAWGVSGLLGLAAAAAVLMTLSWWAVRGRDRDQRVLLGLMTTSAALLGLEVLVYPPGGWIRPDLLLFTAIAARSVQQIAAGDRSLGSTDADPRDDPTVGSDEGVREPPVPAGADEGVPKPPG
jgi:hypothetical protein